MNNCGNCAYKRGRGIIIYCTLFGINIRATYDKCKSHLPGIVSEEKIINHREDSK